MSIFARIAERRIQDAIQAGDMNDLALKGKPLPREDLSGVPEELRMGYKILKNAGFLPEELQLNQELLSLRELLESCDNPDTRHQLRRKLTLRQMQLDMLMEKRGRSLAYSEYEEKLRARLDNK